MPILTCRRVVFYSHGDEAAFFGFAKGIKAVTRIEGVGDAIRLHVSSRPSLASTGDLIGLFRRYKIDSRELEAFIGNRRPGRRTVQPGTSVTKLTGNMGDTYSG